MSEREPILASLEALLIMADEPMPAEVMAQALDVPTPVVAEALVSLAAEYDADGRGFELRPLGGGWRYYTRASQAEVITRYVLEGQSGRLSQAALETLAVVAYLQPISRTRISAVRAVSVDGVVRTLVARGLIEEAGTDEQTGAVVFRTTDYFCERMGINSLSELPDLAPHLPDAADLEAELSQLVAQAPVASMHDPSEQNSEHNLPTEHDSQPSPIPQQRMSDDV